MGSTNCQYAVLNVKAALIARLLKLFFLAVVCSLMVDCQNRPASNLSPVSAAEKRRIELLIRAQYQVPATYEISLGSRSNSSVPGFYGLPVTFSHKGRTVESVFLISHDGVSLARLQKFDLAENVPPDMTAEQSPVRGNPQAKVRIIVFDDLECPFCARFHEQLFLLATTRYKDLVAVVYRPYPLTAIHPWAMHAAINADCLAAQSPEAYWDYIAYVHSHLADVDGRGKGKGTLAASVRELDDAAVKEGKTKKLVLKPLRECLIKQSESAVLASLQEGDKLGVNGTPTIFVNGERIVGFHSEAWISASINRALRDLGVQPPIDAQAGIESEDRININAAPASNSNTTCNAAGSQPQP